MSFRLLDLKVLPGVWLLLVVLLETRSGHCFDLCQSLYFQLILDLYLPLVLPLLNSAEFWVVHVGMKVISALVCVRPV